MPYFKDPKNKVHFLDDASLANKYLPIGSVLITDAEAAMLTAPVITQADLAAQANAAAQKEIQRLRIEAIDDLITWAADQATGQDRAAMQTKLAAINAEKSKIKK